MPRTGLFHGLAARYLAVVDGGLLISQRAVEGRRPPGRERGQRIRGRLPTARMRSSGPGRYRGPGPDGAHRRSGPRRRRRRRA